MTNSPAPGATADGNGMTVRPLDIVTLAPLAPGQEETCPSWRGFALGTLVRTHAECRPVPAEARVLTLDGAVIVGHLPYMHAVGRAQLEAARRGVCVRVDGGPPGYSRWSIITPEGVFAPPMGNAEVEGHA